jgi:phenylalanyl-tRNA synthetase beta chain
VPIANPLSESFAILRPSLIPGLIATVAHNRKRQRRDVRVFEIGSKFSRSSGERRSIGYSWTGSALSEHWSNSSRDVDFFDIKTVSEKICEVLDIQTQMQSTHEKWLVPGRSVTLLQDGVALGIFGQLLPSIAESFGLPDDPVYIAEIELDTTEGPTADRNIKVESLPRFPAITRDVSILVDETLAAAKLIDIKELGLLRARRLCQ